MKRVLIIDSNVSYLLMNMNRPTGGAAVQTSNWIRGFESLGYEIIILSENMVKPSKYYYQIVVDTTSEKKNLSGFISALAFYYRTFKRISPDFIYCSIPWWNRLLYILPAKLIGIKFIQRISNDNLVQRNSVQIFNNYFKSMLLRVSLNLTKNIICQNEYQYTTLRNRFPRKIIQKLYNPFIVHNRHFISSKEYVAWVGLFQRQKNMSELLNIALALPELTFKVAGTEISKGILDSSTQEALTKLKNTRNVEFVGNLNREEIFPFLARAICLLNTSHEEGFSNTYLESYSVGTPVVTRKNTDPDNLIATLNLGRVVDTYEQIPDAIRFVYSGNIDYGERMKDYLINNHDPVKLSRQMLSKAV